MTHEYALEMTRVNNGVSITIIAKGITRYSASNTIFQDIAPVYNILAFPLRIRECARSR